MEQKFIFVLIEKDTQKAASLLNIKPEKILDIISDKDVCEFLVNYGFTSGDMQLHTATSIEEYLGIPVKEVHNAWETDPSDIITARNLYKWICLDTRTKDFNTLDLPFIYTDYTVHKTHPSGTFYPLMKKAGSEAKYLFFSDEGGKHLELYISLLKDIWTFMVPFIHPILTNNPDAIEYIVQSYRKENSYTIPVNIIPYYLSRFYPDEQTEIFVDLDSCKLESEINRLRDATNDSFDTKCTLFYTDLTEDVIHNLITYLETIADDTHKYHKIYIRRYGALTAETLLHHNDILPAYQEKWESVIRKWKEISGRSHSLKAGLKSYAIPEILHLHGQSECNMRLAALNLALLPGNEELQEISVRAILNGKVLLGTNLLGLFGFHCSISHDTLSVLMEPEMSIITQRAMYKDVEIEIHIYHTSELPVNIKNEVMKRLEIYTQLWVSERLGTKLEVDLVKFCYSQLMSRNLSHNIGSHMLLNLQSQTEKIISGCTTGTEKPSVEKIVEHMNNISASLEYIRLKSDYLSAFAFCGNGVTFHNLTVCSINELINKYIPVFNALPDKKINVRFEVQVKGKPVAKDNDIKISLPLSGEFALFNIIESVLRNSIKHEKTDSDSMEIVINFGGKHSWHKNLSSDEINVQIYRKGATYNEELCKSINKRIDSSIIDPYAGQLNYHNLGIKEMKGAVLYMLGIAPNEWEMQSQNPDSTSTDNDAHLTACQMENGQSHLTEWGYLFQLKKDKNILAVIDSNQETESYSYTRSLMKKEDERTVDELDLTWISLNNLTKKLLTNRNEVVSYEFLVFSGIPKDKISYFKNSVPDNHLPLRKVELDLGKIKKAELEEKVWETYSKNNQNGEVSKEDNATPCYIKVTNHKKEDTKFKPSSYNHNLPYEPTDLYINPADGKEDEIRQMSEKYPRFYYVEALSSECKKTSPLYNYRSMSPEIKAVCKHIILEYTTFPVFIIDERIQRLGVQNQLFPKWKLMGIFVPEKEMLDSAKFPEEYLNSYIRNLHHPLPGYELKRGKSALIIHESLLQRWVSSDKVVEKLKELKEIDISVYITTGRGKPQYLTEEEKDIRFIAFSSLYRYCDEMNKFSLYSALQGARV